MRPGRSRGKVEGGRAVEKDVADSGDTVPGPLWPLITPQRPGTLPGP